MNRTVLLSLSSRSIIHSAAFGCGVLLLSSFSLLTLDRAIAQSAIDPIGATTPTATQSTSAIATPASSSDAAPEPPSDESPASDTYLDRTNYSLGATQRETAPIAPVRAVARRDSSRDPSGYERPSLPENTSASPITHPPSQVALSNSDLVTRPNIQVPQTSGFSSLNRSTAFIFPLSIPAPITSLFGWRMHPITNALRFHSGTDIGAEAGTPVLATATGQVAIADFINGYGISVALQHQNATLETFYAHLSEVFVKPGQWVKQGEMIGRVGSTGMATGPNLHFEMRQMTGKGWETVDPGTQLESAMAQLVKSLQTARSSEKPRS